MIVSTNFFTVEDASLLSDAKRKGLRLEGVICPYIELDSLYDVLTFVDSTRLKLITEENGKYIGKWYKYNNLGKIPKKGRDKYTPDFSLDWIKRLKRLDSNNHKLIAFINGKKISVDIHTFNLLNIHTKLFVFDRGFVITSANITYYGKIKRHLEMGVLVTEEDNKLEVAVVKKWFNDEWNNKEASCVSVRNDFMKRFATKIIKNTLKSELKKNLDKYGHSKYPFSNRLLCFGCDEERAGKIINRKVKINNREYNEVICEGCDSVLNRIRVFMPIFCQELSHEGNITWRISKDFYEDNYSSFKDFEKYSDDDSTVCFEITDNGSIDRLIHVLVATNINTAHICLKCGKNLKSDFLRCPYCGELIDCTLISM